MTGIRIAAICLMAATATAACAGSQNPPALDPRVTRIDGVKTDTTTPAPPAEPAAPKIGATAPQGWLLQRDVTIDPSTPPAPVLLVNPSDGVMATVFVVLFPGIGSPKQWATEQRKVFIKQGIRCSAITVSKDGASVSFTTVVKKDEGGVRKGKITFLTRASRKDAVAALYGSWEPKSNKASLADMAKIEASITLE